MTATCPECGATGELERAGTAESTVGTLAARLERRPVVACPQGHEASPPELVDAAMQVVAARVPRARSRLLRSDRCGECGTALTMPVRRTGRTVSVDDTAAGVLTIELDLPLTRCPSCGLDQLPSRSQEDLVVIVPALFAAR